jgi:hypothetical protein
MSVQCKTTALLAKIGSLITDKAETLENAIKQTESQLVLNSIISCVGQHFINSRIPEEKIGNAAPPPAEQHLGLSSLESLQEKLEVQASKDIHSQWKPNEEEASYIMALKTQTQPVLKRARRNHKGKSKRYCCSKCGAPKRGHVCLQNRLVCSVETQVDLSITDPQRWQSDYNMIDQELYDEDAMACVDHFCG